MSQSRRLAILAAHLREALPDDDGGAVIKVGLQQVHHVGHAGCQLAQQPDGLQRHTEQGWALAPATLVTRHLPTYLHNL